MAAASERERGMRLVGLLETCLPLIKEPNILIMTRQELIWLLVLAEISDDYEEPEHIHERVG
jgi:hypothetical protein